jgi:hypothetical protein
MSFEILYMCSRLRSEMRRRGSTKVLLFKELWCGQSEKEEASGHNNGIATDDDDDDDKHQLSARYDHQPQLCEQSTAPRPGMRLPQMQQRLVSFRGSDD